MYHAIRITFETLGIVDQFGFTLLKNPVQIGFDVFPIIGKCDADPLIGGNFLFAGSIIAGIGKRRCWFTGLRNMSAYLVFSIVMRQRYKQSILPFATILVFVPHTTHKTRLFSCPFYPCQHCHTLFHAINIELANCSVGQ